MRRRGHTRMPAEAPSTRRSGIALDPDDWVVRPMLWWARAMRRYRQHRVVHLERLGALINQRRPVVLVGNHVLEAVERREQQAPWLDRTVRAGERVLERIGL